MKYLLLIIVVFCILITAGCGDDSLITGVAKSKPTSVSVATVYQNGTIISNGAIMVAGQFFTGSGTMLCPGIIVKLDAGSIVQIKLDDCTSKIQKQYRIASGERVRCSKRSYLPDDVATQSPHKQALYVMEDRSEWFLATKKK